jgi:hypothetical protein
MAFIACCGITCTIQSFFSEKSHTGCLSAVQQTFVSTPPLTCEPNLRTNLDPSGLALHDQSLATTTKTHRQLAVFPNSHTRHMTHETAGILPCQGGGEGVLLT